MLWEKSRRMRDRSPWFMAECTSAIAKSERPSVRTSDDMDGDMAEPINSQLFEAS